MEQARSDLPVYLGAFLGLIAAAGIIYAVVDAAMLEGRVDSNTSNATTGGPPVSFDKP